VPAGRLAGVGVAAAGAGPRAIAGPVDVARRVATGGVHLAYQASGAPDAPPMVLLHGLAERGATWAPVIPRFPLTDFGGLSPRVGDATPPGRV